MPGQKEEGIERLGSFITEGAFCCVQTPCHQVVFAGSHAHDPLKAPKCPKQAMVSNQSIESDRHLEVCSLFAHVTSPKLPYQPYQADIVGDVLTLVRQTHFTVR